MTFQASDTKGRQFLNLLDNDLHIIEFLYIKEDLWIKYFEYSNSLYIRAIRAIINHAPIREYYFCFFSNKDFSCPYRNYLIESRYHCRRDTIGHLMSFLEFNLNTFSFEESIT